MVVRRSQREASALHHHRAAALAREKSNRKHAGRVSRAPPSTATGLGGGRMTVESNETSGGSQEQCAKSQARRACPLLDIYHVSMHWLSVSQLTQPSKRLRVSINHL